MDEIGLKFGVFKLYFDEFSFCVGDDYEGELCRELLNDGEGFGVGCDVVGICG